jgi:hypothetical protein
MEHVGRCNPLFPLKCVKQLQSEKKEEDDGIDLIIL